MLALREIGLPSQGSRVVGGWGGHGMVLLRSPSYDGQVNYAASDCLVDAGGLGEWRGVKRVVNLGKEALGSSARRL